MADQVNLFGRPGNSAWAQETFVNLAPQRTPSTVSGKIVAGVPTAGVSPAQQAPATVQIKPVQRPGQTLGPAATGDTVPAASVNPTVAEVPITRPTGSLMNAYARSLPASNAKAATEAIPVSDYTQLVNQYRENPGLFNMATEDINDLSGTEGGNWNFGSMQPDALVIHHTAGRGTVDGVIQTFKERGFPAHFVVDREGKVTQVLGLTQKGQHTKPAQDSSGITNSNSWGVEIIAKDDSDVLPIQAAATLRLTNYLKGFGLNPSKVVGHGAINDHKQATEGQTVVNLLRQING